VQFKSEPPGNQLHVIAKLDHILKLYELDKPNRFRLLYKLTYSHLNPVAQSAMKESLAAQVMSHTIVAGLTLWCLQVRNPADPREDKLWVKIAPPPFTGAYRKRSGA
jgi:hypothetical protein